jgi:hypothetical protein
MSLSMEGTDLLAPPSDFRLQTSVRCAREDPGQKRVAVDRRWAWPVGSWLQRERVSCASGLRTYCTFRPSGCRLAER